jgi:glycosidase
MTLPGIPQIYYGNEVGMYGGHDPDNRRFMPTWAFNQQDRTHTRPGYLPRPDMVHDFMQKLLSIRQAHSALQVGSYRELWRQNGFHNANVWSFVRSHAGQNVIVAINNGTQWTNTPLPVNVSGIFADGTILRDILHMRPFNPLRIENGQMQIHLPGQSAVILVPQN